MNARTRAKQIERVRDECLSFPEVTERLTLPSPPNSRVQAQRKRPKGKGPDVAVRAFVLLKFLGWR